MQLSPDELNIETVGKHESVLYPSFEVLASGTIDALASVGFEIDGTYSRDWRIKNFDRGDNGVFFITVAAPLVHRRRGVKIVAAYSRGVDKLERKPGVVPAFFSPRVLNAVQRVLSVYNDGVAAVRYSSKTRVVAPTQIAADNIKHILTGGRARWTTLRGRLFRASVPENSRHRLRVRIREQLTGDSVLCSVPRELLDRVGESLDKRVAVTGRCTYAISGRPTEIQVTSIRPLVPIAHGDLPPLKLTEDDEDAADFVRRLRDAQ